MAFPSRGQGGEHVSVDVDYTDSPILFLLEGQWWTKILAQPYRKDAALYYFLLSDM